MCCAVFHQHATERGDHPLHFNFSTCPDSQITFLARLELSSANVAYSAQHVDPDISGNVLLNDHPVAVAGGHVPPNFIAAIQTEQLVRLSLSNFLNVELFVFGT